MSEMAENDSSQVLGNNFREKFGSGWSAFDRILFRDMAIWW